MARKYGTYHHAKRFLWSAAALYRSRVPHSECTMNIFYIIGVVVVIVIIAGFLGVHI